MSRVNRFLLIAAGVVVAGVMTYALAGDQPGDGPRPALRLGTTSSDESPDLNPPVGNVSFGVNYGLQYAQAQPGGGPGGPGGPPPAGGPGMGPGPGMGGPGGPGGPMMRNRGQQGMEQSPEMAHLAQLRMWNEMSFNPREAGFMALIQLKESMPPEEQIKALEGYLDRVKSLGLRNGIRLALIDLYKAKGDKESMRKQAEAMLMENDAALQNELPGRPFDGEPGRMGGMGDGRFRTPPPPASAPAATR